MQFQIVGDGPRRAELEALVRAHRLEDRVLFLGHREDVARAARRGPTCSCCPRARKLSRTARSKPWRPACRSSPAAVGGLLDLIEHGRTGLLVEPEQPEALAARAPPTVHGSGRSRRTSARRRGRRCASAIRSSAWSRRSRISIWRACRPAPFRARSAPKPQVSEPCAGLQDASTSTRRTPSSRAGLVAMTDAVTHRGPDAGGYYLDGAIGLGHRRLSIIDLATGDQPIGNEDGSVQVIFNGEIYNFAEVRRELIAHGHRFRTNSDTEVIVHGYEQWGERCVDRFRGMFAFAVWDATARRLLLARDRLGVKPLYYAEVPGGIVFGSEIKSLLEDPEVPREWRAEALDAYLTLLYVPAPDTIYRGIHKLPPAHVLVAERGTIRDLALLGSRVHRRRRPRPRGGLPRGARRAPSRSRPAAPDQRRAARRVPLGRHRLVHGRGVHGGGEPRRRRSPSRSASSTRRSTKCSTPRRWRVISGAISMR